jgi:DNA-binding NtrC family response regulator
MSQKYSILIVAEDESERQKLLEALGTDQYNLVGLGRSGAAEASVDDPADLVISVVRPSDSNEFELLRLWQDRRPETPFVVVAEDGDVDTAVEAMKLGACDYVAKPIEPGDLRNRISKWLGECSPRRSGDGDRTNSTPTIGIPPGTSLEDLERAAVERALEQHHGNRTHAAKTLGISVRTLQRKLKAWRTPILSLQSHMPTGDVFMARH